MSIQTNIPQLRFPEFKGEWEKKKFGEVVKINQGLQIDISERYTEKVEGSYFYITNQFLKANSDKTYFIKNPPNSVLCTEKDILMTRTGNTGMVVTNVEGAFHNNFFKVAYPDYISKNFLYNFLKLENTQNQILRMAGTSTIPDLNHSDFYRIIFSFPTLPEQTKIANFLTAIDQKIQTLKTKKIGLENYKKGVMQQLFSVAETHGRASLRFKDTNGKPFPDWEMKKLGEVARITTGSSNRQDSSLVGEFTFFDRSQDIRTSARYLFDGEAIIVPGEGQEFIPKYFIGKFDLHQRTYAIMNFKGANGLFLFYSISFNTNHLNSQAVGSTVKSLRLPMFEMMPINFPSIKEQTAIANFLSAIDEKINKTNTQITQTQQWKKGLLQKMFV